MRMGRWGLGATIAAVGLTVTAAPAAAVDTIRLGKTPLAGRIIGMTAEKVTINRHGADEDVPANRITSILFDGEPPELNLARVAAANGRVEDALETLGKIDSAKLTNRYILQEVEFYKALAAARLALRGTGTIREAGSQMARFVATHRDSYHWFAANELVGDLLVANRQYGAAVAYYEVAGGAPWPEYRMRADVALGRALLAQEKPAEAMVAFDRALAVKSDDSEAVPQRQRARLGKARCLALEGQTDQAVQIAQEVIAQSDPEDATLNAQAYNTLGVALRKAGKPQDALLAYLHVHLLYFNSGEDHAEALANLAELFNEVHQPQRAAEMQELLKERYPNSRWAPQ